MCSILIGKVIRISIPDHISERLVKIFGLKILFVADPDTGSDGCLFDPESGMEKFGSGIRDKHPGSATLLLD